MVGIKNVLVFALGASAAAIFERQVSTIQNDLKTINSDTVALTNAVNKYDGSFSAALTVNSAEQQLEKDINSATKDAQNTPGPVSATDSQSIIDYINNTLEPNIKASINALISKKSSFQSAGLSGTVCDDLKTLKSDTDSYGAALINLAPAAKKSAANSALAKIDADFNSGTSSYGC